MSVVFEFDRHTGWGALLEDDDGAVLMHGVGKDQLIAAINLIEKLENEWRSALDRNFLAGVPSQDLQ